MKPFASVVFVLFALSAACIDAQTKGQDGVAGAGKGRMNVLFIVADDLCSTALACYGNSSCNTPNIDALGQQGTRYTNAYCQFPVCGPSRASFMSGYYPHATGVMGYTSGREKIGDRATLTEHFINHGYYAARVSKIFHMGVPGDIEKGSNGADDARSWTERFNSQGPEIYAPGYVELLENNPDGTKSVRGGNTLEYGMADGDDLVHADGKTAEKACELIRAQGGSSSPFFLAVGFVRPHVPFVAPKGYYKPYPFDRVELPEGVDDDWNDIPKLGINYRTSPGMKLSGEQEKKAIAAYYASVSYMDAQVGKVLEALKAEGLEKNTIVVFTSDHGFHLGEHEFWMKVGLMDESSGVPLIIKVPGKTPAVCNSFAELIDLYPTLSELCGLEVPPRLQGKSLVPTIEAPECIVRASAFCVNRNSFLIRNQRWAFIQHRENGSGGIQLYDMQSDPGQFNNLANSPDHALIVQQLKKELQDKLASIRDNDL